MCRVTRAFHKLSIVLFCFLQYYDESRKVLAEQAAPGPGTPAATAPGPSAGTPAAPASAVQR